MDTKQKKRPEPVRKRSAAPKTGKAAADSRPRQRSAETRSPQTGRSAQQRRQPERTAQRAEQPRRQPERTAQRAEQPRRQSAPQQSIQRTAQETHNILQQNAYAPRQLPVEEQVFKTEQKKQRPMNPEAVKRAEQRKKSAKRAQQRKAEEAKRKKRPEVAYVQPNPINLNQMLMKILIVIAVVVAITLGLSVFFKVEKVMVHGNKAYSAYTIQEEGGIELGSNLLSLNNTRACGKIMAALPYVENVRIGIKLPDTVNIYVEEIEIAYAITTKDGTNWLMTSAGKVIEQIDSGTATTYTKIEGVNLDDPKPGQQARAVEVVMETTAAPEPGAEPTEDLSTIVTGAARLNAALNILQQLEKNDIVGAAASIDVGSLSNIELWYGQRFQVKLGDANNMDIKIRWMKSAVNQRSEYDMGILDVSFTTWPDHVGYTPIND